MKIRAAVLHEVNQPFDVREVDLSPPRHGEVRVRMAAAGVCHSDWHIVTGDTKHPLPVVCGHEGAGVVEEVGEGVTHLNLGDRVVLNWAPACGSCFYCTHGRPALCETYTAPIWAGVLLDGSPRLSCDGRPVYHFCGLACFADHAVVPATSCVRIVNDEVNMRVAALVGCAVTTGVGAVMNTAKVQPGDRVVVLGVGGVGLCAVMGAAAANAGAIIAIDRLTSRCDMARQFGATATIEAGDDASKIVESVRALTEGRGADVVIEAVGVPALQELSMQLARPGGTVVLAGLSPMGTATNLPGAVITRRELTIKGSYYGTADPPCDFPRYLDWHRAGRLPLDRLVSRTYGLDAINDAFADMLAGRTARGVIVWE